MNNIIFFRESTLCCCTMYMPAAEHLHQTHHLFCIYFCRYLKANREELEGGKGMLIQSSLVHGRKSFSLDMYVILSKLLRLKNFMEALISFCIRFD